MRLLFVHEYLGALGGAESNILLTARQLWARGHDIALAYQKKSGKGETHWHNVFSRTFLLDGDRATMPRVIREFSPDLIYLHSMPDTDLLECVVDSPVPIVRMVHDHQLYCMRGYKYNVLTREPCTRAASSACTFPCMAFLQRNRGGFWPLRLASFKEKQGELEISRRCDWFLTYSQYSRGELIKNGFPADRIELFAPVPCPDREYREPHMPDKNLILFAGQIIRGKGVDILLQTLHRVTSPFICVILGDGSHRKYCEKLSRKLGLQNRVIFAGYVPPEELEAYYRDASVAVVSSVWPEPFGMVGPEAMLHGLPVIAFDVGGIREWLEHGVTGFAVPWMRTDQFAMRIDQLLADKQLGRDMGRKGWDRVHRLFHADHQVTRLEQLFSKLAPHSEVTTNENTDVHTLHGIC